MADRTASAVVAPNARAAAMQKLARKLRPLRKG
jgi:hypothetical protein